MQAGTVGQYLLIRLFGDLVNDIQTEAFDALVHPPADHAVDFLPDGRIFPVVVMLRIIPAFFASRNHRYSSEEWFSTRAKNTRMTEVPKERRNWASSITLEDTVVT